MDDSLHALFEKRSRGDDALLRLSQRKFEENGLAAELYAGSPGDLEHVLQFAPAGMRPPTVHLSRDLDLLRDRDRAAVVELVRRFAGRLSGLVLHDRSSMPHRLDEMAAAAAEVSGALTASGSAALFVEYAAGVSLEEFVSLGECLAPFDQVGLCIDVGHVGLREARRRFAALAPNVKQDLAALSSDDPRLPQLLEAVSAAMAAGLPAVESLTAAVGEQSNPVHFHLHDGHPLVPGLSDHFPFQWRLPIPFPWNGIRLDPESAALFSHWSDVTNAERQNAWLAVITESAELVRGLEGLRATQVGSSAMSALSGTPVSSL